MSFTAAVHSLAELIRQEAQGRALVAGLSLGGYVAIEPAYRFPDLAAGLILSGCSFNFDGIMGLYLKAVSGMMIRGWIKQSRAQAEEKTRRMFPLALAYVADAQLKDGVYPEALGPSFAEMAWRRFQRSSVRVPRTGVDPQWRAVYVISPGRSESSSPGCSTGGSRPSPARVTPATSTNPRLTTRLCATLGKEIHWWP